MRICQRLSAALWQRAAQTSSRESSTAARLRCYSASATRLAPKVTPSPAGDVTLEGLPRVTNAWRNYGIAGSFVSGALAVYFLREDPLPADEDEAPAKPADSASEEHVVVNWSGTHECRPKALHQPETMEELQAIVADYHKRGEKLRVFGSALSPNGLGFSSGAMLSLALLDKVVAVDTEKMQVRVQAGCRIAELATALREHGLTLPNYASIREQAIGGFIQVGAHGTGARIPPVEEQVIEMTLVTPAEGVLRLTAEEDPWLFDTARVGLGALGVVSEVLLQCVPAHQLLEHTYVSTMKEVKKQHAQLLRSNQHLRYMWIPHTDAVVVVTNNPHPTGKPAPRVRSSHTDAERTQPFRALLKESAPGMTADQLDALSWSEMRDALIAHAPLECAWIARVNKAEALFWRRSEGYRVGWNDELLGFDCGGQQWVLEAAFPTGSLRRPALADLAYVEQLLAQIEADRVPAPAPIEQRWSASSASALSPAAARDPETITSWVGIIMYLPAEEPAMRAAITRRFRDYAKMMEDGVMTKFGAVEHWAKIEVPQREADLEKMRLRLAQRYPLDQFAEARARLDPKNILANDMIDALFPTAVNPKAGSAVASG